MDPQTGQAAEARAHADQDRAQNLPFASLSLAVRSNGATLGARTPSHPRPTRIRSGHTNVQHSAGRTLGYAVPDIPQRSSQLAAVALRQDEKLVNKPSQGLHRQIFSAVGALLGGILGVSSGAIRLNMPVQAEGRVFPSMLPGRLPAGRGRGPSAAGGRKAAIVWFRNDLRLHDQEALAAACRDCTSVMPVYCFDPRDYGGRTPTGRDVSGPHRARLVLDSVSELRSQLRELGSDLVVRVGRPEEVLPELVRQLAAGVVYCHAGETYEEVKVEDAVKGAIKAEGVEFQSLWSGSLYHIDDLPFRIDALPGHYADFLRKVHGVKVRPALDAPSQLRGMPLGSVEPGEMPTMQALGFSLTSLQSPSCSSPVLANMRGGETQALNHLKAFMQLLTSSPDPKRDLCAAFSCQISPWLSVGCLSPRRMYQDLHSIMNAAQPAPQVSVAGKQRQPPAVAALHELTWRDFFRFMVRKYTLADITKDRVAAAKAVRAQPRTGPAWAHPRLGMMCRYPCWLS